MKDNDKLFFYRIEPGALLDFATDPEGETVTLTRFAKDLIKGQSDIAFIQSIINEARNYLETKRNAGKKGGLAKSSSAKKKASSATICSSTLLAESSTPLASSSNSNSTNKEEAIPHSLILDYLNNKAGRKYRPTEAHKKFIRARWNEGYKLEDFHTVIDNKVTEWGDDDKMKQYLSPDTLFGTKFDKYLNQEAPQSPSFISMRGVR